MTRILHFTTDSRIAGAEKLLIGIAKEYDKSRFELFFCVLRKRGDLNREIESLGLKSFSLDCNNLLCLPGAILKLIFILRKYKINILHTHLFHAGILGNFVGLFFNKTSVLMTRHYSNLLYLYGSPFQRVLDRWALKRAKHIIAISNNVSDLLIKLEGVDRKKISVIHNGIVPGDVTPCADIEVNIEKEFHVRDGIKIIGAIGSLHPRKGHEYLIRAADIICRKRQDIKFLIVGEGVSEGRLINLRDSLGLREKIVFAGHREDIPPLLSIMDIVVHPSLEEGFGISIIEAMLSSKAVIATNVGGIPEIIENGKTGLLIPEKDPAAIADAVIYLLNNPDKMKEMGMSAKLRVREKFSLHTMVKKYEIVYEELINKCTAGAKEE